MTFLVFLSKLDLFQLPISFYYKKQPARSVPFGIIFSLLIYIFMFYSFSKSDVFLKKSPIVISQTLSNNFANPIEFSNSRLIGFQLADDLHNLYYDPSIFNLQLRRLIFGLDNNGLKVLQYQYLEVLRPCTEEDIYFDQENFKNSVMKGSFCLQNKTFSIYGQLTEQQFSYFSVGIYSCDNLTSNNTCKSKEEINNFLSNGKYLTMAMHNTLINVEDFENPMKVDYKAIINKIDVNLSKLSFIFI